MTDNHDKRRLVEEELRDPKRRAAAKSNKAVAASWVLAGALVLALILSAVL